MSLRDELQELRPSAWGGLNTLRDAAIADLAPRLTRALDAGELDLAGLPFTELELMQWLAEQTSLEGVAASFFVTRFLGEDLGVARWSARILARFPAEALTTLRQVIAATDKKKAEVTLILAGELLAAKTSTAELVASKPGLKALASSLRGRAKDAATQVLTLLEQASVPAVDLALPAADDVVAIAASAPEDALMRERIHAAMRWARDRRPFLTFPELADAAGTTVEAIRPQAAAVAIELGGRNLPAGISWCARGVTTGLAFSQYDHQRDVIDPLVVEKLVLSERFASLDAYLAATRLGALAPLRKAKKGAAMPSLRWRDGSAVSAQAQRAYQALLRELSLAALITAALDEASVFDLGVWLLSDPQAHRSENRVLPPSDRLAAELGRADAAGLVEARRYELFSPAKQRWAFRRWTEAQGQVRAELEFTFGRARVHPRSHLTEFFPTHPIPTQETDPEGIASGAWWREQLGLAMEDAMVAQTATPMHAFRGYLSQPRIADALRGVVFHVEDHGLAWIERGRLVNRTGPIEVAGHLSVFVAHPSVHADPWPSEAEAGTPPFSQRVRPSYAEGALEELVASSVSIPNAAWRERCAVLGYAEESQTGGGTLEATRVLGPALRFVVRQSGYGSGYGGARPVALVSAQVLGSATPSWVRSELVEDVRRLVGLDALPARTSPGDPGAPEVLNAAFWQAAAP